MTKDCHPSDSPPLPGDPAILTNEVRENHALLNALLRTKSKVSLVEGPIDPPFPRLYREDQILPHQAQ